MSEERKGAADFDDQARREARKPYVLVCETDLTGEPIPVESVKVVWKAKRKAVHDATDQRAECFKRIKDADPQLTYDKVARQASQELRDPTITGETVRNVYRKKGWKWQRANAIT